VELWIIDVIWAGLVDAEVDQLNAMVYVSRAAQASFDDSSWAELKTQLDVWQEKITVRSAGRVPASGDEDS
jgi:translation initiation factor 3 subunit M